MKVSVCQLDCIPGNIEENLVKIEKQLINASKQNTELICFPELSNFGYDLTLLDSNYSHEKTINFLKQCSKKYNIFIIIGSVIMQDNKLYNSALIFNPSGELIGQYNKNKLFKLSNEHEIFTPGNFFKPLIINNFKIGILICFDIRFAELSLNYRKQAVDLIVIISAFPHPRLDHWKTLIKARAIENQCYLLASNRIGTDKSLNFCGNSCIIDPYGKILKSFTDQEEGILINDISKNEVIKIKTAIPMDD